ncbi:phosphoesterase [Desulfosarcina alkanivorans]|uniref:Phosphoesterase n=1 Tax=Desulfosarcina alkanivorans TaxID=571177 RepID=A0A5K7YDX3_9BACT|nr:metallophosphoesterase family protein [Desulfosarcina alkanivorans]BBO66190.1 phosphoesterase [Desulfosarcina alkanivorans]
MSFSTTIGILSDTHGLLRPEVVEALGGCDRILHAGDIGENDVLDRLKRIAPVVAVRGNMDYGSWSNSLPVREMVEIEGIFFYLLHDLNQLDLEPAAAGIHLVVSGHTHQPQLLKKEGVTYLNPGSAGHRRFDYPVSVAIVRIENGAAIPRIVKLDL